MAVISVIRNTSRAIEPASAGFLLEQAFFTLSSRGQNNGKTKAGKFMNTTKILGEAVGIQRQDIIDRTEEQTAEGLTGAVILGRFKRGRVDAPMAIHQGNIRGQLGHDPKNLDYIAVQDCLDTGVPSVQVLRIKAGMEEEA